MKYLFILILGMSLFSGCASKQETQQQENNTNASQLTSADSSFSAFLSNFKEMQLPYKQDSIQLPTPLKTYFIKDYFLRNFLKEDRISNIEGYLAEYANALQDDNPWNFAWYGVRFPVGSNSTAIIYHTYKQISASNGGTYQTMLATFDANGKMIECAEIAEQSIYTSSNLIDNEREEYTTFSSVYATARTKYEISKELKINILQTKTEIVSKEIQDTKDSTLLAKNQDSTFTKQEKKPEIIKKELSILANGKIKN